MNRAPFLTLWLLMLRAGGLRLGAAVPADTDFTLLPFLEEHCNRCHGEKKQKGEFRLDTLSRDFTAGASAMRWGDVMDRISTGEMPPEKEPQPHPDEAARIVELLAQKLKEGEATRLASRERVSFHKLTREEYANTIYDLLGVHYDAADPTALPEDPTWQGFERISSVLSLSASHVEKYFTAGESILAEAFPTTPTPSQVQHWGALDLRGSSDRESLKARGLLEKVRLDVWPGSAFQGQPGSARNLNITAAGDYRVRIKLSGLKPKNGRAPHVAFYAIDLDRMLFEQDVVAPEDQPVTLEFRTHLPIGSHPIRMTNEAPGPSNLPRGGRNGSKSFLSLKDGREPWQWKLTDEDGQPLLPFLIVDWVEWEGPLSEDSSTQVRSEFAPPPSCTPTQAEQIVRRFASQAFRRPATDEETRRFTQLYTAEVASGEKPEAALRTALLAILCSQDFLYLVEGSPERPPAALNDWELASRLSYFLWSTMPDAELLAHAQSGDLHEHAILRAQVQRMLADSRIERLATSFSRQWLQLRRVGMFVPDKKLYPTFDDYLQKSMIAESTNYFAEVLREKGSLREFLDSNWTMLNARLAEHYGVPDVAEDRFQRVNLRPEDHRGGLLTQAAVLSLTSDGLRHRPVHRGKWVLETIIGKPPPPPPANVKPIEPTPNTQAKATLRMKLASHETDANCAACHRRIDPLGFAFDNYDAIGRWRTEEAVSDGAGKNPPVDSSGELIDGRKFGNVSEFKQLLSADVDKFNAAFTEKLATFALRRTMSIDDRASLQSIAQQSREADYSLPALIESLVLSDLFQKR